MVVKVICSDGNKTNKRNRNFDCLGNHHGTKYRDTSINAPSINARTMFLLPKCTVKFGPKHIVHLRKSTSINAHPL